jgi:hypothetical protein
MCCTNFEYSKVSLEAVNKPFYGFSQYTAESKINIAKIKKIIVISGKSMRVRPESVTHLVVKLFNVKSKFDYIDKNKQKSI